jgi:hypothetical protein
MLLCCVHVFDNCDSSHLLAPEMPAHVCIPFFLPQPPSSSQLLHDQQTFSKARADALSRVGSRSSAADFISQLLLWARPAAWFPQPLLAALLQLAGGDLDGEQGDLVRGAFQLAQRLSKVGLARCSNCDFRYYCFERYAEAD